MDVVHFEDELRITRLSVGHLDMTLEHSQSCLQQEICCGGSHGENEGQNEGQRHG